MLVKLALFAAAGALLAMTATQIPPKANLAWQFDHSTDVVQVEVLRPATVSDARDQCEMLVWEVRAIRTFKGTLPTGATTRVWGPGDKSEWKAGSERLLFLDQYDGQPHDACSSRVFSSYKRVHWGGCCEIQGEGSDARMMFGTVIDSETAGPDVPVQASIVFDALQALASESPHGASSSTDLTGTASFACGMSDGPATLAHLQVENSPATWWIFRVEGAAPEDLDGRYPIKNSARSGTAFLRVCDNALNCTHAAEGAIVVTGQRPGGFEGSVEYRLPNEALERRTFSATIEAANVVCL